MIEFLKSQKTHLLYIIAIVVILGVGYNLFSRKPKEVVKTVIETKYVNRNIVKTEKQYVDRVIVTKAPDGTTTTTTEKVTTADTSVDKSRAGSSYISKTSTSYLSRYSLDIQYPIAFSYVNFQPVWDVKSLIVTGGVRIGDLPAFVTLGTNVGLNQALVGFRLEF